MNVNSICRHTDLVGAGVVGRARIGFDIAEWIEIMDIENNLIYCLAMYPIFIGYTLNENQSINLVIVDRVRGERIVDYEQFQDLTAARAFIDNSLDLDKALVA